MELTDRELEFLEVPVGSGERDGVSGHQILVRDLGDLARPVPVRDGPGENAGNVGRGLVRGRGAFSGLIDNDIIRAARQDVDAVEVGREKEPVDVRTGLKTDVLGTGRRPPA